MIWVHIFLHVRLSGKDQMRFWFHISCFPNSDCAIYRRSYHAVFFWVITYASYLQRSITHWNYTKLVKFLYHSYSMSGHLIEGFERVTPENLMHNGIKKSSEWTGIYWSVRRLREQWCMIIFRILSKRDFLSTSVGWLVLFLDDNNLFSCQWEDNSEER